MRLQAILFSVLISTTKLSSQSVDWQHKDIQTDSIFGISTNRAFNELLKSRMKPEFMTVAIIDSGIDTLHIDLLGSLWTDRRSGIHGWNYIAVETGKEDVTMLAAYKKTFYDSLSYTFVPEQYRKGYQLYRKAVPALKEKVNAMQTLVHRLEDNRSPQAQELKRFAEYHLEHGLNINNTEPDTAKGNADVTCDKMEPTPNANLAPYHGTHVAGIIGAKRDNNEGINGIAERVHLMALKVNGNIRELRDKNLAASIRFAVDNGAKILNISMGKPYTWNKNEVDSAVKYAMRKGVMIVHAAGNDRIDIDHEEIYPNGKYEDGTGKAESWIEVGASDKKGNQADFSNYGKSSVDVFAPGVNIYSTIPGNKYDYWSGTSMAAPVVSGLAALIWGYYPKLTAVQVKEIIMKSVVKRDVLKEKCVSGGVVNAYNALKLAATYR